MRYFLVICCALNILLLTGKTYAAHRTARAADGNTIIARTKYIIDGDSIMVIRGSRTLEIRLWGIDAPEFDQPGSEDSRKALTSLVGNRDVLLVLKYHDKYGRLVAIASTGEVNVNEEMIRSGNAWVHNHYCNTEPCDDWVRLEQEARARNIGIWQQSNAIAPWRWKAQKKKYR